VRPRSGLGLLFFAWLYGVPFLLIVGLIRRMSSPYLPTHAAARSFGAVTDALLIAALVANIVLPVAGVIVARVARDDYWRRHFAAAFVGTAFYFVLFLGLAGRATAPLIGYVPGDLEPTPQVTQCIPRSGGHGCPGG
jgi:hypothetical protein